MRGTRRQFGGISESSQSSRGEGRHGRLEGGGGNMYMYIVCSVIETRPSKANYAQKQLFFFPREKDLLLVGFDILRTRHMLHQLSH